MKLHACSLSHLRCQLPPGRSLWERACEMYSLPLGNGYKIKAARLHSLPPGGRLEHVQKNTKKEDKTDDSAVPHKVYFTTKRRCCQCFFARFFVAAFKIYYLYITIKNLKEFLVKLFIFHKKRAIITMRRDFGTLRRIFAKITERTLPSGSG